MLHLLPACNCSKHEHCLHTINSTGVQARHVLNESRLPKHTLAEIWKLSDLNQNGKLTQDEFVIAMHLCDQVKAGLLRWFSYIEKSFRFF